nr:hypothetical protein [Tanacetum cinerariifolium]
MKKVQGMDSYEFLLTNKKRGVNADVFRTFLDICSRVEDVNFTDVPNDDTTLAFLIKLGYKCPLYKHTNMFVDHTHQPWRTLAAIIHKCLSGKTASNDKLHSAKKSRGRGSQGKKSAYDSQETVDVSKESEPEPELVKRKTSSKSISQTEAEEAEEVRHVHATHAKIMIEFVPGSGTERKMTSKRQPGTGGSSERTGTKPGVPNESTVVFATSSEGTEQESEQFEEDKLDDKEKDDKECDDDEDDETEYDEDDIYKYKIRVHKDKDEEMLNAEVDDSDKDVSDLKKIDLSAKALASLKTQVPIVVDNYLGSKVRDVFQKELDAVIVGLQQEVLQLPRQST